MQDYRKRGFITGFEPINISNDFKKIISFLNYENINGNNEFKLVTKKGMIEYTKAFFADFFSLHKVLILPSKRAIGFLQQINENDSYKDVIDLYCHEEYPFAIEINHIYGVSEGYIVQDALALKSDNLFIPYFRSIVLPAPIREVSYCDYAQQIVHTQVDSIYGSIQDFHNKEVISLFIEKLCALNMGDDIFCKIQERRLGLLRNILSKKQTELTNELVALAISTIKAEHLFNYFLEADDVGRSEILNQIQKVFDGQISVEQLLASFSITYENSLNEKAMERNLHH